MMSYLFSSVSLLSDMYDCFTNSRCFILERGIDISGRHPISDKQNHHCTAYQENLARPLFNSKFLPKHFEILFNLTFIHKSISPSLTSATLD